MHDGVRIARQPPVGGLLQLGDRVVHRDTGLRDDVAHLARGIVTQFLDQGPHGACGQQTQRLECDGALRPGTTRIEHERSQAVEDAGAFGQREQAPSSPDRGHSYVAVVGAQGREHWFHGTGVGDGLERQQQRRFHRRPIGGGEVFENLPDRARADDGQPRDRGLMPHRVVALQVPEEATDFKAGRSPDCHG